MPRVSSALACPNDALACAAAPKYIYARYTCVFWQHCGGGVDVVTNASPSAKTGIPADIVALAVPVSLASMGFSFMIYRAFAYDPEW